jgi:hypothetical protein
MPFVRLGKRSVRYAMRHLEEYIAKHTTCITCT